MDWMDCMLIILFRSTVLFHDIYSNNYIRSASQLYSHSRTRTRIYTWIHAYNLMLLRIEFHCYITRWLCSIDLFDLMVVFLVWNYINDIARTSHIFLSGVTCDNIVGSASYGRITSISISYRSLTGTLPSTIGNFQSVTSLNIGRNSLKGTIPSTINGLISLTVIAFYSNSLTGTIPTTISALTSLTEIYFHSTSLTGTIPSTISALTSLTGIYVSFNSLTGTIPSAMSALTSLTALYLDNNYLTMGAATSVPISTFSATTLSGSLYLESNCLVFDTNKPYRHVTATHCRSTTTPSKY